MISGIAGLVTRTEIFLLNRSSVPHCKAGLRIEGIDAVSGVITKALELPSWYNIYIVAKITKITWK